MNSLVQHDARLRLLDAIARRREAQHVDAEQSAFLLAEAERLEAHAHKILDACSEPVEEATRYQLALRAEEPSALVWIARELLERASEKETRADVRASIQSALSALGEAHRQQESP